jgi:transcriptional regulator with XRE-family HTH domain
MNTMHIRLKSFRENVLHLSQEKTASAIGITQRAYAYYELGKSEPSIRTLATLSELGCDLIWLITGRDPNRLKEGTLQEKLELAHAELVKVAEERDKSRAQVDILKEVLNKTLTNEVDSKSKTPDRRYAELRADIEMLNSVMLQIKKNFEIHEIECKIVKQAVGASGLPKEELIIPEEEMESASPKMREALSRYRGQVDALMEFGARMAQEWAGIDKKEPAKE